MPVHMPDGCEFKDPVAGSQLFQQEITDNPEQSLKDFMGKVENTLSGDGQGFTTVAPQPLNETEDTAEDAYDPVDLEDPREFIRTLLAGERFSKAYTLFGDTVIATLQTRTVHENEQLRTFSGNGARYNKAALRYSLASLRLVTDDSATEVKTGSLDELNDVLCSALIAVFRQFESLCDVLFKRADDVNFWKGTGGRA